MVGLGQSLKNLKAMTWEEFHELFMDKYFLASTRHVKARDFLELKQGTMIVLEYMAKYIELVRFVDDYVATNMAKVRKFEDDLKLSIRGKIMGLFLQDIDSMVKTAISIEREVDDSRSIWDAGVSDKRKESQPSFLTRERIGGILLREGFRDKVAATRGKAKISHPKMGDASGLLASQGRGHVSIATILDT